MLSNFITTQDVFFLFHQENIYCGYSLEVPQWGYVFNGDVKEMSVLFGETPLFRDMNLQ